MCRYLHQLIFSVERHIYLCYRQILFPYIFHFCNVSVMIFFLFFTVLSWFIYYVYNLISCDVEYRINGSLLSSDVWPLKWVLDVCYVYIYTHVFISVCFIVYWWVLSGLSLCRLDIEVGYTVIRLKIAASYLALPPLLKVFPFHQFCACHFAAFFLSLSHTIRL